MSVPCPTCGSVLSEHPKNPQDHWQRPFKCVKQNPCHRRRERRDWLAIQRKHDAKLGRTPSAQRLAMEKRDAENRGEEPQETNTPRNEHPKKGGNPMSPIDAN